MRLRVMIRACKWARWEATDMAEAHQGTGTMSGTEREPDHLNRNGVEWYKLYAIRYGQVQSMTSFVRSRTI